MTGVSEHRSFLLGHTGSVGGVPRPMSSAAYDFSKGLALAYLLCEPAQVAKGKSPVSIKWSYQVHLPHGVFGSQT